MIKTKLLLMYKPIKSLLKSKVQMQVFCLNCMLNRETIWMLENHFSMLIQKERKSKVVTLSPRRLLNKVNRTKLLKKNKSHKRLKSNNKNQSHQAKKNKWNNRRSQQNNKRKKPQNNNQNPQDKENKSVNLYQD